MPDARSSGPEVIVRDATAADMAAVRDLCRDYRAHLAARAGADQRAVETSYPARDYEALLMRLESEHQGPGGHILVAEHRGRPVGCGMSHALAPGVAEIKRVFVAAPARGLGAGRALCVGLLQRLVSSGFARVYLDTMVTLPEAMALYRSLGFRERGPYADTHDDIRHLLRFFEWRAG